MTAERPAGSVTFTLDGRRIDAQPGETILLAARRHGVDIPHLCHSDGLRADGVGSKEPVEGLLPEDPANRRIDFAVVATTPLQPTPVDTPGPR